MVKLWKKKDIAGAYPEIYVQVTSLGNLVCYRHLVIDVQTLKGGFFFSSSNFDEIEEDKTVKMNRRGGGHKIEAWCKSDSKLKGSRSHSSRF